MSKIVLSSLKNEAKFLKTDSEGFWLYGLFSELCKKNLF